MVKKSQVTPSGIIKDAAKQLAEYYSERFSEHRANLRKKAGDLKDKLSNISLPTIAHSASHPKSRKNHRHTLSLGKISIICAAFFLPMIIVFCAATNTHQESDGQQQPSPQSETIASTDRVTVYSEESTSDEPTLLKPDKSKKTYSSSGYRNYDEGPLPYDEGGYGYGYNYDPGPIPVYDSAPSYSEPTQTTTDEPDQTETTTTTDDSETTDSTEPETTTTTDTTTDQSDTEPEPTTTTEPTESATTESTEEP